MFDNQDIEDAVRDGVISRDVMRMLRNRAAQARRAPTADEERFSGSIALADVMASIGLWMALSVMAAISVTISPIAAGAVAPVCWVLAEYFTHRRRQILASVVLFIFFVLLVSMVGLGVGILIMGVGQNGGVLPMRPTGMPPTIALIVAATAVMACVAWWTRFRLPMAYAAAVIALINIFVHVARIVWPDVGASLVGVLLLFIGVCLFLLAMWWDMSDVRRETVRSDVGFWLHAAAGFQIAGASYRLLFGVAGAPAGWDRLYSFTPMAANGSEIAFATLLFVLFCWIALIVDRRALLMSAMAFLVKMQFNDGLLAVGFPLTLTLLGIVTVLLSIFWSQLRALAIEPLPLVLRAQLPRDAMTFERDRPVD
ncbi:hypothetical protein OVY48_21005 [Sphingobium sp. SA2]|uniref:hypothetical protein n=1 Tax=Sphingobium sp. SA2 TaxID=1524832 RepID=UPI0028C28291|nr:hypothetical protein [Sphingobium sp. SA2]MDT7535878.1 hypothetical protein [Sphingobium sp. SA2]